MQKGYGTSKKTSVKPKTTNKKMQKPKMDREPEKKKVRRNNTSTESESRTGFERLSPAEEKKIKEHSEHHSAKHIRKMKMLMTKEGKSFSAAHKIAISKAGK